MRYAMNADEKAWKEFSDNLSMSREEVESRRAKEGAKQLMRLFGG